MTPGVGWITLGEVALLREAVSEFQRLDQLASANLDYYAARFLAARILAGRVEDLVETLRQRDRVPCSG